MDTTSVRPAQEAPDRDAVLRNVERRVLWLATAIIDHANRVRPNPTGLKVGGHQASCASMVSIMTELWFERLHAGDRVSVKPHASPVLHAINHLLGELDAEYLTTLRSFGGLQSYPSRSKDPDPVDYSTGSVGIGATAPIWGALARRYVSSVINSPSPENNNTTETATPPPATAAAVGGSGWGGSTRCWGMPSWTRGLAGRRCSTRWSASWARSCGSWTSTGSPSTGSSRRSGPDGSRACSPRPAGR
ncbi:hypothetical protein ACFQHO_25145 [Actinomadura yumaensis]|uniref:hypothetical protein n=1 Tax=Actinomadura yumaensis TaxID=111807 RepID=UPI00361A34D1